jgi:hypothetical protein
MAEIVRRMGGHRLIGACGVAHARTVDDACVHKLGPRVELKAVNGCIRYSRGAKLIDGRQTASTCRTPSLNTVGLAPRMGNVSASPKEVT